MSMDKHYYIIAGYDLTNYKTDEFDEWKCTSQGESYLCYQRKGQIQLFDDSSSGQHLYFGYILAAGDEYYYETSKFDVPDIANAWDSVTSELIKLIGLGVVTIDPKNKPIYQIIAFEECR